MSQNLTPYVTFRADDYKTACRLRELVKNWGTFQDGNRPEFAAKLSMMPREGETIQIDNVEFKVVQITYTAFGDVFRDQGGFWRHIVVSISAV